MVVSRPGARGPVPPRPASAPALRHIRQLPGNVSVFSKRAKGNRFGLAAQPLVRSDGRAERQLQVGSAGANQLTSQYKQLF